jgi:hypothetical protein
LVLGSDLSFQIKTTGTGTIFNSTNTNNSLSIQMGSVNAVQVTASGQVGINNPSPASTLDVGGSIKSSGNAVIGANLSAGGTLSVSGASTLGDDTTVNGQLYLNWLNGSTGLPEVGPAMLPSTDSIYDLGSPTAKFRNVYAQNFVGDFSGTFAGYFTGAVDGSATQLANPTIFSLAGDVTSNSINFNGATLNGTATFTTTLSSSVITNQPVVATDSSTLTSVFPDKLLVYQQSSQSLVQMTKSVLFNHVPLVPVGCIFPFAGPASAIPAGYLLCDGAEVLQQTYSTLYKIIGYTYSNGTSANLKGAATFKLPDLRGRFPLGADNMNNNITVPSSGNANNLISTVSAAANRVSDTQADNIGAGSDSLSGPGASAVTLTSSQLPQHTHNLKSTGNNQYYAVGGSATPSDPDNAAIAGYGVTQSGINRGLSDAGPVLNTTTGSTLTGQSVNIMNPYLTINYIIYTGVGI